MRTNDIDDIMPQPSNGRGGPLRALGALLGKARRGRVESDLAAYAEDLATISGRGLPHLADDDLAAELADVRAELDGLDPAACEGGVRLVFPLVREAARRTLGLDPYAEQVVAGLAMVRGRVAELPTGEGKTLAAVFPAALHALAGRGVHVLTFNDYLARRDAEWMGPAYRMLGLTVGCVQEGMPPVARRAAYRCDVTYLTAKEAGFDLLRDGLVLDPEVRVHRELHVALVDEADSILVDEARIPLVIAGVRPEDPEGLPRLAELARRLERGADFGIDDGERNIYLTDRGIERAEGALGCDDLFSGPGVGVLAALRNALHSERLLRRDVDYIVRGGAVELVDELTGRVAENRHWPDGLQAAVEAKEGLDPGVGGSILGSITLQHFLRLYPRLCGMTATATSAAEELREVYGLEVTVVPPHRPCVRVDAEDLVFVDSASRDRAVADEVVRAHEAGQPVLVGTGSVEASERLAVELHQRGVDCLVLNARNDEEEAGIVAGAGDLGRVTISTNMAGRGTDIRLGGAGEGNRGRVAELGGLYVIGTTRHSSAGFEELEQRLAELVADTFERLDIGADGVDWEAHGLRGPSATWTYLVDDNAFAPNVLRMLANHAGIALFAVLLWAPLLFVWGLYLHWRRRRVRGANSQDQEES